MSLRVNSFNRSANTFKTKIADKTTNFIVKSPTAQKILKNTGYNPSLVNSAFVFLLSTTLRPATIMLTPTNKEDKKYSAVRSVATGIADLAISLAIYTPINKVMVKAKDVLRDHTNSVYKTNKEAFGALNTLINRGSKFIFAPAQVFILFWLMPKLVKVLFPNKSIKQGDKK